MIGVSVLLLLCGRWGSLLLGAGCGVSAMRGRDFSGDLFGDTSGSACIAGAEEEEGGDERSEVVDDAIAADRHCEQDELPY